MISGGVTGGVSGSALPAMVADVVASLVVESLESVVNRYVRLTFTRARAFQLQTDALSVVTIAWDFRERYFASPSGGGRLQKLRQHLDELCGLLLRSVALLTAPLPVVLPWLEQYVSNQSASRDSSGGTSDGLWSALPWLSLVSVDCVGAANLSVPKFDPVAEMSKLTSGGQAGEAWDLTTQPWFHDRSNAVPWK